MSKRNRAGQGSLTITLSRNTALTVAYTVDSDEGVWLDDDGGSLPSYSAITVESVMCNGSDITNLVEHFEPLKTYILEQISNEEN